MAKKTPEERREQLHYESLLRDRFGERESQWPVQWAEPRDIIALLKRERAGGIQAGLEKARELAKELLPDRVAGMFIASLEIPDD